MYDTRGCSREMRERKGCRCERHLCRSAPQEDQMLSIASVTIPFRVKVSNWYHRASSHFRQVQMVVTPVLASCRPCTVPCWLRKPQKAILTLTVFSLFVYTYMCVSTCMSVSTCMCMYMEPECSPDCSPPYALRQGLSFEPRAQQVSYTS